MSVALLDVNVLVALLDSGHSHHERAFEWFMGGGNMNWATCPVVENGAVRIIGHPNYPGGGGVPNALDLLAGLLRVGEHEFWPDSVSLLDANRVDRERLLTPKQTTDTYLLALAVANRGRLATFDRRLAVQAVRDGAQALMVL